jgi:3-methyladenine DNA glycosylase AlkD
LAKRTEVPSLFIICHISKIKPGNNQKERLAMVSLEEILKRLEARAEPDQLEGMARFGMVTERRLGVSIPILREMSKELGKDHKLAVQLWETGIPEARILAAMVEEPGKLSEAQMEDWVKSINSWDVCDQVCQNLFEKSPVAWKKVVDWSKREEEFTKRAAYALLACLAWHDQDAKDAEFIKLLPVVKRGATDERNFVKKAVSWALRNIGKRNLNLNKAAIKTAKEILRIDSSTARWIASDTIRELSSAPVQRRLRKKKH